MKRRRRAVSQHPKNRTQYRSLNKIAASPKVKDIWEEDNGVWIALTPGFNFDGMSHIHRDETETVADLIGDFSRVERDD